MNPATHLDAKAGDSTAANMTSSHLEDHAHVAAVGPAVLEVVQHADAGGGALGRAVRVPRDRRQQVDLVLCRLCVMLRALLHLRLMTAHTVGTSVPAPTVGILIAM